MRIEIIIERLPYKIAHYMSGRIKTRWQKGFKGNKDIPDAKEPSKQKRISKASRGKDVVLFDTGHLQRSIFPEKRGKGEAAVISTDYRAGVLLLGSKSFNIPERDVFKVVITEELTAEKDLELVNAALDKFDKEFVGRKL